METMTTKSNKNVNEYYNPFSVGDDVFVNQGTRRWRGSIILIGNDIGPGVSDKYMIVEDCDERHITVTADQCEEVCEGCDGYGVLVYPAHQRGGDVVDEQEVVCRMCKGTGVPKQNDDEYDPE